MSDSVKGAIVSKTIWFSAILALLGFIEQYQGLLSQFIGTDKMGLLLMGVAAVSAALRALTTSSLADKVN